MKNHAIRTLFVLSAIALGCKGPQGPAGPAGSSGAESLIDPSIQPKVIYTYPTANSVGPYADNFTSIHLRFNKIMDRASMTQSLALSSSGTPIRIDTNSMTTLGGDIWSVQGIDSTGVNYPWKLAETYSLKVRSSAKDVNGNSLVPEYVMSFTPEPYFRVKRSYPLNGTANVSPSQPIRLYFNSKVDSTIFSAIEISPPVPGNWRGLGPFNDSSNIYIGTDELNTGTMYTMTVNPSARDKYGNIIGSGFTSSFSTSILRVSNTSPSPGNINVHPTANVSVVFNSLLDTGRVRLAFRIVPAVSGVFLLYQFGPSFLFRPDFDFLAGTEYTVSIDTSIRSRAGGTLQSPYVFSFTTAPMSVEYTSPQNGDSSVSRYLDYCYVTFNVRLDTSTVRSAFSSPGINGNLSVVDGSSHISFSPVNLPLPANTTYTITISTALRSKSGSMLASPYSFSFTTGE